MENRGFRSVLKSAAIGIVYICIMKLLRPVLAAAMLLSLCLGQAQCAAQEKDWTVMVYMCADNDLEEMAIYDFLEMEQGITDNINVIVMMDRARGFSSLYGDETGTKIYEVRKSAKKYDYSELITGKTVFPEKYSSRVIADLGELDLSDPQNIAEFVKFSAKNYPARRYALIPWDHGGGWKSMMMDLDGGRGAAVKGAMTAGEFAAALDRAVTVLPGQKFDVIIFEMCLMGQLDVLKSIAPYADFAFAAPPVMPAVGFDYSSILSFFTKDVANADLVMKIADNTRDFLNHKHLLECAYSVYDLGQMGEFTRAFAKLNAKLESLAQTEYTEITRTLCFATHLNSLETDVNYGVPSYWTVSVYDWLNQLRESSLDLGEDLLAEVEQALDRLIFYTTSTSNTSAFEGVSVYLPMRRVFMDERYPKTDFAKKSGLSSLLAQLYKCQEQKGNSQPRISDIEIGKVSIGADQDVNDPEQFSLTVQKEIRPFGRSVIRFKVTGEDILWTYLNQLERKNGKYLVHYSQLVREHQSRFDNVESAGAFRRNSPYYKNGTTTLLRELTAQKYLITNGLVNAEISIQNTSTSDTYNENISIGYARYTDPSLNGQELHVKLKFSNRTRLLIGAEVVNQANNQLSGSALTLKSDGVLRPELTYMDTKGQITLEYGSPMNVGSILALTLGLVDDNATVRYVLSVQSVGGKTAFAASEEVTVRHEKALLDLIDNTRARFTTELSGRYALLQYATTADGVSLLPNFRILSLNLKEGSLATWTLEDANGTPVSDGLFNYIVSGVPQLMLHERHSNNLITMLGPTIQSYYCFLESSGSGRQWYLVGLGDGTRSLLVPLDSLLRRNIQGVWTSDTEYWNITSDAILLYRFKEKLKATGSYSTFNNLLRTDGLPFEEYAFYADKTGTHLTLMTRDGHVSFLTRKENPEVQTETEAKPDSPVSSSQRPNLEGRYQSDAETGHASMVITRKGQDFEMVINSKGQGTIICYFTVQENYLDARFGNGERQKIGYHIHDGDYLTLFFDHMPPITFKALP